MTGAEVKFFPGFVVFVNGPRIRAAELGGMRDDARQNRWKIQGGADRTAHFAQSLELIERVGELLGRSEEHTSELQSRLDISYAVFCLRNTSELQSRADISYAVSCLQKTTQA